MRKFRRILFGEPMPDRNDPAYRDKYERDKSYGRRFASMLHLDSAMAGLQNFADRHSKIFLCMVFGIVLIIVSLCTVRLVSCMSTLHAGTPTAISQQEAVLQDVLNDRER